MTHPSHPPDTSDICLLLRAHGEQRWLIYELVPVVRQIEQQSLPDEQLGAALAYLEALRIESRRRASETDAVYAQLQALASGDVWMQEKARRYHAAVRRLRAALERRIDRLLSGAPETPEYVSPADRCASP